MEEFRNPPIVAGKKLFVFNDCAFTASRQFGARNVETTTSATSCGVVIANDDGG